MKRGYMIKLDSIQSVRRATESMQYIVFPNILHIIMGLMSENKYILCEDLF